MTDCLAETSLCITPIAGVVRYHDGPEELQIGDVRFLSWQTLSMTWASCGFHSSPVLILKEHHLDLEVMEVVALLRVDGKAHVAVEGVRERVERAFKLLLACNSPWGPGGKHSRPVVGLQSKRRFGFAFAEDGTEPHRYSISGHSLGPIHEIKFDGFWPKNCEAGFYNELNVLLSSETLIAPEWKVQLLEATNLLGHSRLATSPWEAFLFSMIGMERLLKKGPKERWCDSVEERMNALFSWLRPELRERYSGGIVKLYELRNRVAHAGRIEAVRPRHAALADEMLFNLLLMGYKHFDEAKSLDELAQRGERIKTQVENGERQTALPNAAAIISAFDDKD
jgi:hypothetical protein